MGSMGFSKSKKEMVAFANNPNACFGWHIDCIWTEQRSISLCLCLILAVKPSKLF